MLLFPVLPLYGAEFKTSNADLFTLSFKEMLNLEIRTAGKKAEEIRGIPASVTIITRQDIEKMGYVTLEEILINTPGFYHIDDYDDFLIGIRGTVGSSIAFLINGIPIHPKQIKGIVPTERARMNVPVEAIDRIEIIRGPMSVIYGNNAFLGAVNIITNEAAPGTHGIASASCGNVETGRIFARASGSNDQGSFTVNAGGYQTDGIEGDYADMMSPEQFAALLPGQHRRFDGHLDHEDKYVEFSGAYKQFKVGLRYGGMDYGSYGVSPGFRDGTQYNIDGFHASLGYAGHLSDTLSLKADLTYSSDRLEIDFDLLFPTVEGYQHMYSKRLELETVLEWDAGEKISIIGGLRNRYLFDIGTEFHIPMINFFGIREDDDWFINDVFTQLDCTLTPSLKLILGARGTHINAFKIDEHLDPNVPTEVSLVRRFKAEDIFTPRAALVYTLGGHHTLKAMYGEATQHNNERTLSDIETIKTVELNYLVAYPRWSFSLSGFQNTSEDLQRRTTRSDPETGAFVFTTDSSGELETYGLEAIFMAKPLENLEIELSCVWQDTEDKRAAVSETRNSPALLAKAKGVYSFKDLTLALFGAYVDEMKADLDITPNPTGTQRIGDDVDDYVTVGANLRYRPGGGPWFFNLHGSNIFDERIRYPASELVVTQRGSFGPQQRFLATIGYVF